MIYNDIYNIIYRHGISKTVVILKICATDVALLANNLI